LSSFCVLCLMLSVSLDSTFTVLVFCVVTSVLFVFVLCLMSNVVGISVFYLRFSWRFIFLIWLYCNDQLLQVELWCSTPLSTIFLSFIGGGNRSTQRKPLICRKSLTNLITKCCIEYISPWAGFAIVTLMVIGTDYAGSCK